MPKRNFEAEFDKLTAPLPEEQSDKAIEDEWHVYSLEDEDFRRALINRIAELSGVKTGRELFNGKA